MGDVKVRRRPTQARSRERFEQVIRAAGALIGARGLEPVTMTDIAAEARMAVTAVYRYFPSKQAIVRELAQRIFEEDTDFLNEFAQGPDLPAEGAVRAVADYCHRHLHDALRLQVRAAIHADAELAALDLADSRRNASLIAETLEQSGVPIPRAVLERRALILVEILDSVIRLAARVPEDEAEALITEFAESVRWTLLRGE